MQHKKVINYQKGSNYPKAVGIALKKREGQQLPQSGGYCPEKEKQLHTQLFLSAGTGEKKRISSHP